MSFTPPDDIRYDAVNLEASMVKRDDKDHGLSLFLLAFAIVTAGCGPSGDSLEGNGGAPSSPGQWSGDPQSDHPWPPWTTSHGASGVTTGASNSAAATSTGAGGTGGDAAQICVDKINAFRATLGLPAYARWSEKEACVGEEAQTDYQNNQPHSGFGHCQEWAQNECPDWPSPAEGMIAGCLQMMWNEGPGSPQQGHGHYVNMSSTQYTRVACGFYTTPQGKVWATQDFK
jgi:hypothetical protein